jgi:type IV pilus assembly protein PilY1
MYRQFVPSPDSTRPRSGLSRLCSAGRVAAFAWLLVWTPAALAVDARDDSYSTLEDTQLTVLAPGVLGNDVQQGVTEPIVVSLTQPANGSVVWQADGFFSYVPKADFFGTDTFEYTAMDDGGVDTALVTITVEPVNDAPSFTKGPDVTVLEDAGPQTFAAWATNLSPGPANESDQTLTFIVTNNSNEGLFSTPPAVDGITGDLTFTTAADANGSATIELVVRDSGGTDHGGVDTSPPQTFVINVTPVNDAPSFTGGGNVTVNEDSGAYTQANWATDIVAGPADESGQTVWFNVLNNDNEALFAVLPQVDPTGTLSFTPADDAFGSATVTIELQDSGGTANGGEDTSAPYVFTITVNMVNDPPTFTPGPDQEVLEDAGPQTVPNWVVDWSVGPQSEVDAGQTISFVVIDVSDASLFASGPEIDPTGTLTYTPADDAFGAATITVVARDSGGTANGGQDTSDPETFQITILPVNDPPSFTGGGNVTVDEDTGPHSIAGWATDIVAGPPNESDQTLEFVVLTNDNEALFSQQPEIDPATGTLSFDTVLDGYGTANLTIVLKDDGGTEHGGEDTSAPYAFSIVVNLVNDLPLAQNDSIITEENSDWVTIPVMCNDYVGDTPTRITQAGVDGFSESEPTTFMDQLGNLATEPNGEVVILEEHVECQGMWLDAVSYRPKPYFNGEDYFTYTITDRDGDTSTATVTITVTPVNNPPVGIQQKSFIMLENSTLIVDAESGLVAGAYDPDGALIGGDGEPIGSLIVAEVVSFPTSGSLTYDSASGAFQYTPLVNFTGTVEFEYRLYDGIDYSEGEPYRVTITVVAAPPPPEPPPAGEVAILYSLANVPLEQSSGAPPNVLVVMDDSGSMDWQLMVAEEALDGGFLLDNSEAARPNRRAATSFVYLWDLRNNAYPDTSEHGRIVPTPEAIMDAFGLAQDPYGTWRARSHLYNRIYYNPEIRYTPWVGQDAANVAFADADPGSIRLDPVNPSTAATTRIDMLATHTYRSTSVPVWDDSGGTTSITDIPVYIPHYYRTGATPPLAWNDAHELVEIRPGAGPLGGDFPGGPEREDCRAGDGNPLVCTYEQEIQNFANYFQYYRSREYVTKHGIGAVVSQLQDVRVGYLTISATTREPIRDMNPLYTEGNKKLFLDNVYRVDSFGGTPLRQALGRAGDVFACNTAILPCPVLPAPLGYCQQNFALLFSDGYWNGGAGITGNQDADSSNPFDGGRYADGVSATLADVAMYYYKTDLHTDMPNEVPVMRRDLDGVPPGVFSGPDPKMHQHMKTYAIAFGVTGTVDPADVPIDPSTPFDWPNPFDGNLEKVDDMLHAAVNGRGRFLSASDPRELRSALETAFLEFTQAASSTSSAAFNSTSLQEGTLLYRGFYDLRDNTGELTATLVDSEGRLASEPLWRASERLNPAHKLPNNRVIVTFDPGVGGRPFRHASLTPEQQDTLNPEQVDYLRGVRTFEQPSGTLRERPVSDGLLGDIVNSSPVFVGAPRSINRDQQPYPTDDLYSQFAASQAGRTPVVYVGANDGMLHGFHGEFGDELFAYVPNKLIDSSQDHRNSLDQFTSPFYQHRYFVDLSPRLNDVYMRPSRGAVGKSWNTVLVGGLGAGGKGYFALNVTRPDVSYSSETQAQGVALWEFTDEDDTYPVDSSGTPLGGEVGAITDPAGRPVKDLGYAVATPVVAMSNVDDGGSPSRKEWVALFGNGPNSTAGIAKLFVLFMDRGLNGWGAGDFVKLNTGFGVQSPPHPLAGYPNFVGTPAAVDTDLNGTVDRVYAGDRLGNLFRFDLSSSNPNEWSVTRLFTASYDDNGVETIQPIVTEPLVIKHPTQPGFLVIFGTGSYLTRDDANSSDIQSIYAIWDDGSNSPATAQADSKETRLVQQTITNVMDNSFDPPVVRRILTKHPVDYQQDTVDGPGTYGWYIDLDMERAAGDANGRPPPGAQYPGEKAIRRLLFRDGAIITTTVLPSLDEFSCFGTRPGSILIIDAKSGGDAGRPVVDFNNDGYVDSGDLVSFDGDVFAGGLLFNQSDLDGQLVDLSTLGGEGDTDWLFVSGGNETISFLIDNVNDSRTGRLSWRELNLTN